MIVSYEYRHAPLHMDHWVTSFQMQYYSDRLETFKNFPIKAYGPRPSELASLGFYYLNRGSDVVGCFSCYIEISDWGETEDILNKHLSLGPCEYMDHIMNY